jgi:hypothetical protein
MIAVLVIEDVETTRTQLVELIRESVTGVDVYSARDCVEVNLRIKELRDNVEKVVAIVDVMIPAAPGGAPEYADGAVSALIKMRPMPSLLFVSAYETEDKVETWRANLTSEDYQPRSYFISKSAVDWGDQVVKRIKERIYGPEIEGLMNEVYGPSTTPQPQLAKVGRTRVFGLTHRLEILTARIREHYADLHTGLQERIRQHFDVDDTKVPPEVEIK